MTDVRLAVYDHILATGRVPLIREIAERVSQPVDQVSQRLRELQAIHAFALAPASDEILMAHPFSAVPTPYRVRGEGRAFWANCAWDAVAIPAMLGCDATVDAHCPDCRENVTFEFSRGALQPNSGVVHFLVEPRNFWRNVVFTWATIHAFRSEAHVDRWCEQNDLRRGYVMPVQQNWELGRRWYVDRLSPEWAPKTPAVMNRIFEAVGLRGDFWRV